VFSVDVMACPKCNTRMQPIAVIQQRSYAEPPQSEGESAVVASLRLDSPLAWANLVKNEPQF
jgi:hypothetical protein